MKNFQQTLLCLILSFLALLSSGQRKEGVSKSTSISKWMHATINIECRSNNDRERERLISLLSSKQIDFDTYRRMNDTLNRVRRTAVGTAIFLKYLGVHYLLTARHVLSDTFSLDSNAIFHKIILIENSGFTNNFTGDTITQYGNLYKDSLSDDITLFNLGTGPYPSRRYIFSSKEVDLGLINLDVKNKRFVRTLLKRGYIPITDSDINTEFKVDRKKEVMCIGFPQESFVFEKPLEINLARWESSYVTVPLLTRGKFLTDAASNTFFEAGIFTYYGNSGGPIISENKLIGIVSGFYIPFIRQTNEPTSFIVYRDYHSRFIKSSFILPLIKELESRIARF